LPDALQGVVQLLQFPKGKSKPKEKKDAFNWWRDRAIEARYPKRGKFVFGNKIREKTRIPFQQGFD